MKRIVIGLTGALLLAGCSNASNPPDAKMNAQAPAAAAGKSSATPFEYRDGDKTYVFASADSLGKYLQTHEAPPTEMHEVGGNQVLVETTDGNAAQLLAAYQKNHK